MAWGYNNYRTGGYGFGYSRTTVQSFKNEMEGTTSVLGRDKTIDVTFTGEKAFSKDGVVNFPNLDPTERLSHEEISLYRGWVDHESAKMRYSDKGVIDSVQKVMEKNPMLFDVFNTIEGIRAEKEYAELYVGAGRNLGAMAKRTAEVALDLHQRASIEREESTKEKSSDKSPEQIEKEEMRKKKLESYKDPKSLIPSALGIKGREDMNGVYNFSTERKLNSILNAEKLDEWAAQMKVLESTEESWELAQTIIEELNEAEKEEEDNEGSGEGSGETKDEDGDSESMMKHQPISMDDILNHEESSKEYSKDIKYRALSTEYDLITHWTDPEWHEDIKGYMELKESVDSSVNTLKRKIELLIQAQRKISWDTMKEEGRFDSKRMVGAYNADPNVFKTRDDASDLDTAITILVDLSGSMIGHKAQVAAQTCILMAECLDKIGVPFNITGFDCNLHDKCPEDFRELYYRTNGELYGRIEPLRTHEFKRFNDRMFDARKYMSRIATLKGSGANNSDGESVFYAGQTLLKRPEKRKIMFVLSDGSPSCDGNMIAQRKKLKEVVKDLSRQIDMVGIGICTGSVRNFYPENVVIHNPEDLTKTCFDLLKKALVKDD